MTTVPDKDIGTCNACRKSGKLTTCESCNVKVCSECIDILVKTECCGNWLCKNCLGEENKCDECESVGCIRCMMTECQACEASYCAGSGINLLCDDCTHECVACGQKMCDKHTVYASDKGDNDSTVEWDLCKQCLKEAISPNKKARKEKK